MTDYRDFMSHKQKDIIDYKAKLRFSQTKCLTLSIIILSDMHSVIPKDPYMLFSYINMKLRDTYSSLDALCDDMHVNKENLCDQLAKAGFQYSKELNKFW